MTRFLFCKEDSAVWISHLDMMRMFQRAFNRAGIAIRMTNGFNPHAYVAIALPLPVGMQSSCEILDCGLADESLSPQEVAERLNHAGFPEGIRILEGYASDRKFRDLRALQARLTLEYDHGVPTGAAERIAGLLTAPSLVVPKRTKKGMVDTDIRPLIHTLSVSQPDENHLFVDARVSAGEPSLNPELLIRAVERDLPDDAPDFYQVRRIEVFDENGEVFR